MQVDRGAAGSDLDDPLRRSFKMTVVAHARLAARFLVLLVRTCPVRRGSA